MIVVAIYIKVQVKFCGFGLSTRSDICVVLSFLAECYYNESQINVTVFQYLHDVTGDVHVNYTVEHNLQEIPIAFDIYLNGQYEQSVECSNENILDRQGMEILKVIFKEMCKDPAFIIKKNLTVNLTLGIDMKLNEDQPCNTVTIGPQSECMPSAHTKYVR